MMPEPVSVDPYPPEPFGTETAAIVVLGYD